MLKTIFFRLLVSSTGTGLVTAEHLTCSIFKLLRWDFTRMKKLRLMIGDHAEQAYWLVGIKREDRNWHGRCGEANSIYRLVIFHAQIVPQLG